MPTPQGEPTTTPPSSPLTDEDGYGDDKTNAATSTSQTDTEEQMPVAGDGSGN